MFVLVCAAGTFIREQNVEPDQLAPLTLAGGALAWGVNMSGAFFRPRGPEKAAVGAAGLSVAEYISAVGTSREDTTRHAAAAALHAAWSTLVTYQPVHPRPAAALHRLRALNRELHVLFAEVMDAAVHREAPSPSLADRARALSAQAQDPPAVSALDDVQTLLGRFSAFEAIRDAVTPGSPYLRVAIRVGLATGPSPVPTKGGVARPRCIR